MTDPIENAEWWWSLDEERYFGPCDSRSECILEAWSEGHRSTINLVQAIKLKLNTAILDGYRLAEMFDDANEEAADPEGDPISCNARKGSWDGLATRLNFQIAAFVRDQGLAAWGFDIVKKHPPADLSEVSLLIATPEARAVFSDFYEALVERASVSPYLAKLRNLVITLTSLKQ